LRVGGGVGVGGEAIFQQSKVLAGRKIAEKLRTGESSRGPLSNSEAKWVSSHYNLLESIHEHRASGGRHALRQFLDTVGLFSRD
jgi:hypothetical protein